MTRTILITLVLSFAGCATGTPAADETAAASQDAAWSPGCEATPEEEQALNSALAEIQPYISTDAGGYVRLDEEGFRSSLSPEDPLLAVLDGEAGPETTREAALAFLVGSFEYADGGVDDHAKSMSASDYVKILSSLTCIAAKAIANGLGYTCPSWAPPYPLCIPYYLLFCARSAS